MRLRRGQTDAEIALWKLLRNRHLDGVKFRRQHEFGPYVLDFYCPAFRLAIEADGSQHSDPEALIADEKRRAYLQTRGLRLVRFTDTEILTDGTNVLERIYQLLEETPSPQPSPSGERE